MEISVKEPKTVDFDVTNATIAPADIPKTADEAIRGSRERQHQGAVSKAARAASTIFADIQAAKGSGMTQETGRELENAFKNAIIKTADTLRALDQYRELVKEELHPAPHSVLRRRVLQPKEGHQAHVPDFGLCMVDQRPSRSKRRVSESHALIRVVASQHPSTAAPAEKRLSSYTST